VARRRPAQELRTAIDCLPLQTRKAMLDGLGANRIIVGAYVDRDGGVCPMLAAHRNSAELRELESRVWTRPFRRLDDVELTARELRALERDRRRREEPARESLPA
jgi:hypothetical protein